MTLGRVQDHPRPLHRAELQRDHACPPLQLTTLLLGELDHMLAGPRHDTQFPAPPVIPPNTPQDSRTRPLAVLPRLQAERFAILACGLIAACGSCGTAAGMDRRTGPETRLAAGLIGLDAYPRNEGSGFESPRRFCEGAAWEILRACRISLSWYADSMSHTERRITVGDRGRVVLPSAVRRELDLNPALTCC